MFKSYLNTIKMIRNYWILKKSPLFDAEWYLKNYPDVREKKKNPIWHYLEFGWKENRLPSVFFDGVDYLKRYPDVNESNISPLLHYELFGKAENRYYASVSFVLPPREKTWKECLQERLHPLKIQDREYVTRSLFFPRWHSVKNQPFFSVILPTFNRAFCIENAIRSCLDQSYQRFELIICDDSSTDGTVERIRKNYSSELSSGKIKFISNASGKKGCASARNTALAIAKGDWITYLDSDNRMRKNALATFAEAILRHRRDTLFYACFRQIYKKGIIGMPFDQKKLLRQNFIDLGVFVHHREMYEKYGGFDEKLKCLLDWELIIRYSRNGNTPFFLPEVLLDYNDSDAFERISTNEDVFLAKQQIWRKYPDIFVHRLTFIDREKVYQEIMAATECGINSENSANPELIISLTSYPARIKIVIFTLHSLLTQTHKPDAVVLWLTRNQFPGLENDLPPELLNLRKRGLTIRWCNQAIRSYTKLIPALKEYPDAIIVTADDDIYYPPDWLEKLYLSYLNAPENIHCHRVHQLQFDPEANLLPYCQWKKNISASCAGWNCFLTGVGGVLYPPGTLHPDVTKSEKYLEICPTADDIWFWGMAVLQGTQIQVVPDNQPDLIYTDPENELNLYGECTLHAQNIIGGGNDLALQKLLTCYPRIQERVVPNRIVLHKMNGEICNKKKIPGLNVQFLGGANIVRLHEPLPVFIDCEITCGSFCSLELDGSRHHLKDMDMQVRSPGCKITIGSNFSANGGMLLAVEPGLKIEIGRDCMFSSDVQLRTSDSHSIIDRTNGKAVNPGADIVLGDHVWLCSGVTLLKGAQIASDSIVAAGSLVNRVFSESGILLAGTPAKVIRDNISWSRKNYQKYTESVQLNRNRISAAFICDDQYVIPTATALTSLIRNKDWDTICDIYIVTANLSTESIEKFKLLESPTVHIKIIKADMSHLAGLHHYSERSYCVASTAALLKFELPRLLPEVNKLLYLDGDIIVRQDLSELFAEPVHHHYAGVVLDSGRAYSKNKRLQKFKYYFNSGVLLMNLDAMRKNGIPDQLIEAKRNSQDSSLMDQNIFNQVLAGKIRRFDIKYNFLYINLLRARAKKCYSMEDLNRLFGSSYRDLEEINREAVIVHFASKDKPWKYHDVALADEWYSYFKASPFADQELNRSSLIYAE